MPLEPVPLMDTPAKEAHTQTETGYTGLPAVWKEHLARPNKVSENLQLKIMKV